MPVRKAMVTWMGGRDGAGEVRLGSGNPALRYTWASRFEEEAGSDPEKLLAGPGVASPWRWRLDWLATMPRRRR
jgi:hypothetical protein